MSELNQLFKQSLHESFFKPFKRQSKNYNFQENGTDYVIRVPSRHATAFRIETDKLKIFGSEPPADVCKMCDAIFIVHHNNKDFVIAVEIKTQNKDDYKEQLYNARLFCQWQIALLREYGHLKTEPVYSGMLIRQTNPS